MNEEQMELISRGFNQGYMQACGDFMKLALDLIKFADEGRILRPDKTYLCADLSLQAKNLLRKKKLMPYTYDVLMGKAEEVKAPWEV